MALKTQLIFLINRFNQQLEMKQKDLFQKTMVSNYIFYKDGIYAHTVLNDEDLDIYKKHPGHLCRKASIPAAWSSTCRPRSPR